MHVYACICVCGYAHHVSISCIHGCCPAHTPTPTHTNTHAHTRAHTCARAHTHAHAPTHARPHPHPHAGPARRAAGPRVWAGRPRARGPCAHSVRGRDGGHRPLCGGAQKDLPARGRRVRGAGDAAGGAGGGARWRGGRRCVRACVSVCERMCLLVRTRVYDCSCEVVHGVGVTACRAKTCAKSAESCSRSLGTWLGEGALAA